MVNDRETVVTTTFVELAGSLARGADVVDLYSALTERCTQLLDIAAVGLLLADGQGTLHVAAASSNATEHLEAYQVQQTEGPCLECYASGEPVLVADLPAAEARWPRFVTAARLAGFASVHALPMHLGDSTIGAMGLFGETTGELNTEDLGLGQAFADFASIALLQERAVHERSLVIGQLQRALDSRVVIEQAKGVLAQTGGIGMDQAFLVLRRFSRNYNLKLGEVAERVAHRELPAALVLEETSRHSDA